ncbi:hypothetical protein HH308_21745 [Gordonia sp. TBRC 11910]|uniref:Uncharacterized protein n=1 Tax=Gordonia asplenii TaxID=2725283 RepID=A0A848KYR7_9ACTN|nr:DUF6461 domain-containing protein [Gordonia asplenii]NMO03840.1 hypothetical protein [Gordonia asplenii]
MSGVTSADFGWFAESFPGLDECGYCLTLVSNVDADGLLSALGAHRIGDVTGVGELNEPSYTAWDEYGGDELVVGVATLDDGWAMMLEENGYLGITGTLMQPVSVGREIVAHYRNVDALDHFVWWRDGIDELSFEPLFATSRSGAQPDGLLDVMRDVGFRVDDPDTAVTEFDHTAAAFALAERITGVTITADLLNSAHLELGRVTVPH